MRRLFLILLVASAVVFSGCVVIETSTPAPSPPGRATPVPGGGDPPQAEPRELNSTSDRRLLGSLGWALLSADVPRAVLEIDQLGGTRLSSATTDALEQALREHGGKENVEVVVDDPSASRDVYSLEDLVSTSEEHRDHSSEDGSVAVQVLVLPGRFQAEGVPGVAFHATVLALFPEEIARLLPPGAQIDAFEAAVAKHELGHTFGLVNRTGVGAFHEDPERPGHTSDEDSVMYWAIESPSLRDLFGSGPPSSFNAADRREMEMIRQQRP